MIQIDKLSFADGHVVYQLSLTQPTSPERVRTIKTVASFDGRFDYNASEFYVYPERPDGLPSQGLNWRYRKVNNTYLPSHVSYLKPSADGKDILFQRILTLEKTILNEPLPAETFTVVGLGLKERERLLDRIERKAMIFIDGKLVDGEIYHTRALVRFDKSPVVNRRMQWLLYGNVFLLAVLSILWLWRKRADANRLH